MGNPAELRQQLKKVIATARDEAIAARKAYEYALQKKRASNEALIRWQKVLKEVH
jgi:hypothetical protein